jgi:coproporphyrinogen III oxidase
MYDDSGKIIQQWFGGGQDLTPIICLKKMQDIFIKRKTACDKHNPFYPKYKNNVTPISGTHIAMKHVNWRLFFDYCKATEEMSMENWFNFVSEVGNSFLKAYVPLKKKKKVYPIPRTKKTWQEIRRGRYVEFNLVHDKGTLFGLKPMEELNLS